MGDSGVSLFTSKTLESAEEEKSINNRTPQPTHFLTEKFACHNFQLPNTALNTILRFCALYNCTRHIKYKKTTTYTLLTTTKLD